MKTGLAAIGAMLLALVTPVAAHRVDEYLQAVLLSVEPDRIRADLYLTPGVAVMPLVLAAVDTNGDGVLSTAEREAYAARVLGDLSVTLNGTRGELRLVSATFPSRSDLQEGMGDIHLEFEVALPRTGPDRRLRLENRHQSGIAVYQVNCLRSRDPAIRIGAQHRNESQSVYELEYTQVPARP